MPPSTLTQISCPATAANACVAIGSDPSGAVVVDGTPSGTSAQTWFPVTLPNGPRSGVPPSTLTQISCPATAANACLAIGSDNKGAVIVAGTPWGTAPSTWFADTLPNGPVSGVKPSSLTPITCPATAANACLAIGSDSSGAVVVAGTQSATSQTWQADTLPGGVAGSEQITCFNGAPCVATGVGATTAAIVTGTLANTSETFGGGVFTVGPSQPLYLSGIACFAGATPTCEAAGASTTGSLVLSDANITPTWWTSDWTSTALPNVWGGSNNITGLRVAALPVGVSNSQLPGNQFYVACATCTASSIGPLFPFAAGDSVGRREHAPPKLAGTQSALAPTVPGTPDNSSAPVETLPLGLLPVQVVNANGTPAVGATVTASVVTNGCTGTYNPRDHRGRRP